MRPILVIAALLLAPASHTAAQTVVFEGQPLKKIQVDFTGLAELQLDSQQAAESAVRVVEHNGRYFWASREMKELKRSESGAYVTYHAIDGSGYVRTAGPLLSSLLKQLSPDQRHAEAEYVEHLLLQFASITYYGKMK
jgi:hypothetical protein